ncbi:MAG: FMN-binding negative transcriptional regulator [Anaerolineae bacterium]
MYIPKSFQETDLSVLHAFMQEHNFATLVTNAAGELAATHLPLMLDTTRGEYGTLLGHMAKANAQWKAFAEQPSLLIFHGAHTYISPNWYTTHPSVPTWNYAVVHAYGTPRIIDDSHAVEAMLQTLVTHHEAGFSPSWEMDLPDDYMHTMMQAIVAFEIPITRLEGKFKLSQNRSQEDQARVTEALLASTYPPDRQVGTLMQEASTPD